MLDNFFRISVDHRQRLNRKQNFEMGSPAPSRVKGCAVREVRAVGAVREVRAVGAIREVRNLFVSASFSSVSF